jgi:hypothetical protein
MISDWWCRHLNGLDLITAGLPTRIRSGSVYHHRKQAACFCNTTCERQWFSNQYSFNFEGPYLTNCK